MEIYGVDRLHEDKVKEGYVMAVVFAGENDHVLLSEFKHAFANGEDVKVGDTMCIVGDIEVSSDGTSTLVGLKEK